MPLDKQREILYNCQWQAVKKNGLALQYVNKALCYDFDTDDNNIQIYAVKQSGLAIQYVDEEPVQVHG